MRFAAFFVVALVLFSLAPSTAHADTVIPLDLSGTRPAVSVTIGDSAPELWVFDTGAGGSVIDMDRAHALNLPELQPVQIGSPAGGTPMQGFITRLDGVRIGAVTLPVFQIVAASTLLPDRAGVLSPNIFAGQLVTLDFGRNELRISDKTSANTPAGAAVDYFGHGPHALPGLEVRVGDGPVQQAHIDSGSPGGLIFPYAMASSLPLAAPPVQVGQARFVDGAHPRYAAQLRGVVHVGPLTLENPEIGLIDGLPYLNIGMGLLSEMVITLDPAERRSWARARND